MSLEIKVECLRCRHVGRITERELERMDIKSGAPIASFIKRLRCCQCGSQSVRAERQGQRKAS
jgi:phage FluMu protein Com